MKTTSITLASLLISGLVFADKAHGQGPVQVRDERGQLLMTARSVQLKPGRSAIPVSVYERLGLYVKREVKTKRVAIGYPDSDVGVWLYAGSRRVRDFLFEKPTATVYDAPVAVIRNKSFYANASVVSKSFKDVFAMTWNPRTHTIVLQRTKQYAQTLHNAP